MAIRAIRTIGGIGAQGAAGASSATAPPAPNLTALAVTVNWRPLGNGWQYSFAIAATLPVADVNYSHLKTVQVIGSNSATSLDLSTNAPFSPDGSNKIYFSSIWYDAPLPPSFSDSWTFTGYVINDLGSASGSPATAAVTVNAPSVSSVTASQVANSVYQDQNEGLHMVVQISPTLVNPQYPLVITLWLDFNDGRGWVNQGWYQATGASPTFRIGDPIQSTGATTEPGMIWVPTDPSKVNWKAAAIAGPYSGNTPPSGFVQYSFTVTAAGTPATNDVTGIQFTPNPDTGDPILYSKDSLGTWFWVPYELKWLQPSFGTDPYYWFSFFTVQKGYAATGTGTVSGGTTVSSLSGITITAADVGMDVHVGGALRYITSVNVGANSFTLNASVSNGAGQAIEIWRQAADYEGKDDLQQQVTQADMFYKGRQVTASGVIQGGSSIPGTWVRWNGDHPPNWTFPPAKNLDGSTNLYRTFRFRVYAVSRRGTNESGGSGAIVLQASWPSGADHYDLTPAAQPAALDLTQTNPNTISGPLSGGGGSPVTIPDFAITNQYISDVAVQARNMAAASVTYANSAVDANALVDSNIASTSIGKLIAGTVVFSGDVAFSRGSGLPVMVLNNGGMFLYSGGNASGSGVTPGVAGSPTYSASGLTSQPYVGIQSTQVGVFSSNTGPSVTITGTGVNLWSVNGSTASPYMNLTSSALALHNGNFTLNMTAAQIQLSHTTGYSVSVTSTGITLSSPGTASVSITSSSVSIVNGSLTINGSPFTINLDSSNGFKVTGNGIITQLNNSTVLGAATGLFVSTSTNTDVVQVNPGLIIASESTSGTNRFELRSNASVSRLRLIGPSTGGSIVGVILDTSSGMTLRDPTTGAVNVTIDPSGNATFNGIVNFAGGTSGSAFAGAATLPSNPVGFINVKVGGSNVKVAYYN